MSDSVFVVADHHHYLSTACQHELHRRCRRTCKFCGAPCGCGCHGEDLQTDV